MAKCIKCGTELPDGTKFCSECGTKQNEQAQTSDTARQINEKIQDFTNTEDTTSSFDQSDIANNKFMSILCYLGWLVVIPLLASKSKYVRFHVNQGLVLAIIEIVWGIVQSVVTSIVKGLFAALHLGILGTLVSWALSLIGILFLILSIIGIVNAASGRAKKLPIIGGINILQ